MNATGQADKRRQLFFSLVVFLAVLVLAFAFRNVLRETVLVPILYLFWAGNLALKSFDQSCVWAVSLMIVVVASLAFSRQARKPVELPLPVMRRAATVGRIRYWKSQIRTRRGVPIGRHYLTWEPRRLVLEWLAYCEHTTTEEIMKQIRSGQFVLPDEFRYVLGLDDGKVKPAQPAYFFERIKQWLDEVIKKTDASSSMTDPQMEQVANILESFLEVEDDI